MSDFTKRFKDPAEVFAALEYMADPASHESEGDEALAAAVLRTLRAHRIYAYALRMMVTAGSVGDDQLGRAYKDAGGGYEGLQAVAALALTAGEREAPDERWRVTVEHGEIQCEPANDDAKAAAERADYPWGEDLIRQRPDLT